MLAGDRRPTAIFAASDTQALGRHRRRAGARAPRPDDLSVIGYDDIEAADYVGLTTVRQQLFESGRRGAEILLAEIERRSDGATRRPAGARARGPRDHGASEGGPWMRAHARRSAPARDSNEEERSWSASDSARKAAGRRRRASPRWRSQRILVAACAAPGAVSTPSRRGEHRAAAAAAAAPRLAASHRRRAPRPPGPNCGTDPVELNAYFETGFDLPFKLSEEFTKQFPNVTWNISQDQFANLMTRRRGCCRATTRPT